MDKLNENLLIAFFLTFSIAGKQWTKHQWLSGNLLSISLSLACIHIHKHMQLHACRKNANVLSWTQHEYYQVSPHIKGTRDSRMLLFVPNLCCGGISLAAHSQLSELRFDGSISIAILQAYLVFSLGLDF